MSTALYLKLSASDYFKGYPQAIAYVHAASSNSDGFRLIYRILELVHPRLRQSKGGMHKTIPPPTYSDITDDSIYTFLKRYKNFLMYEKLSPQSRIYNDVEQTTFIINALRHDARLRPGLYYVESTLQAYQRDVRLNSAIPFPLELQHDEIGVVIDEHSDDYTVGANASLPTSIFNSAHKLTDDAVIHALHSRRQPYKRNDDNRHDNKNTRPGKRDYTSNRDSKNSSTTCKACHGLGHCVTKGDICYILAKATVCHTFMASATNKDHIQRNALDFKKERKEKTYKAKTSSKMRGMIRKMVADGSTMKELTPIINLAQAIEDDSDDGYDSDDSASPDNM